MAESDAAGDTGEAGPDRPDRSWSVFGDATGFAVFLGALAAVGATWQVGVFIADTYAVANGLVSVAHGSLAVERVYYSLTLGSMPGLSAVDGQLFARNYGQAFLALPLYYALDALTAVVDLHLLLVAAWALVVAAFCRQLGVVAGRRGRFRTVGSVLAAGIVVASVPLAEPIDDGQVGIAALQVLSMLAVAVTALAMYRAGSLARGRRVGVAVGATTVLATPLWFWAAIPKRHGLVAAAVAVLLFWFVASRDATGRVRLPLVERAVPRALALRAAGYALVGLVAWVHAFEGVVLFGVFAAADLSTASRTSRRALAALAVATAVGFAPFLATNLAVTGNPFEPPRLAPSFSHGGDDFEIGPTGEVVGPGERIDDTSSDPSSDPSGETGGAGATAEPGGGATPADAGGGSTPAGDGAPDARGGDSSGVTVGPVLAAVDGATRFGRAALSHGERVVSATERAPGRLYRTYVRSGHPSQFVRYGLNQHESIDLSLLESNPLLGGLAAAVVGGAAGLARGSRRRFRTARRAPVEGLAPLLAWRQRLVALDPARLTDLFAVGVVAGFGLMYFPRLPLVSQLTVRYLVPTVPAFLYLLVRVPAVAGTVEDRPRLLAGSYAAFVALGALAVGFGLPHLDLAVGEAVQLHALANLAACGAVTACVLAPTLGISLDTRVRAVGLGLGGAATTVLVASMQLVYFEYGTYAVPLVRVVADAVAVLS